MIAPDIPTIVDEMLAKEAKVYPHRSNWASDLGEQCLRKLVYYRTDWDRQSPPSIPLQGKFSTGHKIERLTKNILNEIGSQVKPQWELVNTGVAIKDDFLNNYQIGGVPDTFLKVWGENGEKPQILGPVEIKGFDSHVFDRIETLEDMKKIWWMRRYIAQLSIYEVGSNFEIGWFLLVNKSNLYQYRFLQMRLDFEFAESLILKAQHINQHLNKSTLPEKLNSPQECCRCCFAAYCCPDLQSDGTLKMVDDLELEQLLDRRNELGPLYHEYEALEKQLKRQLIGGQDLICGNNLLTWQKIEGSRKPIEGGPFSYWRKKITRTDKLTEENDLE